MAEGEKYQMSMKDLKRLEICQRLKQDKQYLQREAAVDLGISVRQLKRLYRRFKEEGPPGLIHRLRGQSGNRKHPPCLREKVLKIIKDRYRDFNFTFISELLSEEWSIVVSREQVRKWMISADLWKPRRRKTARIHQARTRRARVGELIQIDGSDHDWFEGRGPRCTLIAFIDDATSAMTYMKFVPAETTEAYMEGLKSYLLTWGIPIALYSDRHSIFRENKSKSLDDRGESQFQRACRELEIDLIHANTPQAKGRIERSFLTHQDRLLKLLRLNDISTIEEANQYVNDFYIPRHNGRFGKTPQDPEDAHRSLIMDLHKLKLILSQQYSRKVSKNLTVQFENTILNIKTKGSGYGLRGARITICKSFDGQISLLYKGRKLDYESLRKFQFPRPLEDRVTLNREIDAAVRKRKPYKPAADHPWRRSW